MTKRLYSCGVCAEYLDKYREGGLHPVHLGDSFHNDRYRAIHKLGSGGFSTVWLARDQVLKRNVALKILVSKVGSSTREHEIMKACSEGSATSSGAQHISQLLEEFELTGPNGIHQCLVYELLGPTISVFLEKFHWENPPPANIARKIAKELLLGLQYLHGLGICHGDVHTNNIAFTVPGLATMSERRIISLFGLPRTGEVKRKTSWDYSICHNSIKLIDFGQSFAANDRPETFHNPLVLRPPETLLSSSWDYRVDLWTAGCTIFELIIGCTPFMSLLLNETRLIHQMIVSIEPLPQEWQPKWEDIKNEENLYDNVGLQEHLERWYVGDDRPKLLSDDSLRALGKMLKKLLRLRPEDRHSVTDALRDPWFQEHFDYDPAIDMRPSSGASTHGHNSSTDFNSVSEKSLSQGHPSIEPESCPSEKKQTTTAKDLGSEDSQTSTPEDSQAPMLEASQVSIPEDPQVSISEDPQASIPSLLC